MLLVEESSDARLFRHLSNNVFWNPSFRKYISYEGYLFLEGVQNFIYISKIQKNILKKIFVFQKIASELAAWICVY